MVTRGLPGGRCQHNLSYALPRRAMLEFRTPPPHPISHLVPSEDLAPEVWAPGVHLTSLCG